MYVKSPVLYTVISDWRLTVNGAKRDRQAPLRVTNHSSLTTNHWFSAEILCIFAANTQDIRQAEPAL
jgi:hypothetical protein